MESNRSRVAAVLLVVIAAIVLFAVLSSSDDQPSSTSAPQPPPMEIEVGLDAKPIGGLLDTEYIQGQRIRIKVNSAVDGEIHFHGYDISKEVRAGGSVSFDVPARLQGIFEIEMEDQHKQIANVVVDPG